MIRKINDGMIRKTREGNANPSPQGLGFKRSSKNGKFGLISCARPVSLTGYLCLLRAIPVFADPTNAHASLILPSAYLPQALSLLFFHTYLVYLHNFTTFI